MRAIEIVRALCPRAAPDYVAAFEQYDDQIAGAGIYETPHRLAHFLAQIFHESGGLTVVRESGTYKAARIMEIFGVGRHSAAVTAAEAAKLAGDGPALFERAYGLGNPRKARELGNTQPGDGWRYRGNGALQTTGRGAHRRLGEKAGLGDLFERDPGAVMRPQYVLVPAVGEWRETGCNALADANDIRSITKRINGGYNGLSDRVEWFNKIWKLINAAAVEQTGEAVGPSWQSAAQDPDMKAVQSALQILGLYTGEIDGLMGEKTEKAVRAFQKANGLWVDGIPGKATKAILLDRVEGGTRTPKPQTADPPLIDPGKAKASGAVSGGLALSGELVAQAADGIASQAHQLEPLQDVVPFIRYLVGGLLLISAGLTIYGFVRPFLKPDKATPA